MPLVFGEFTVDLERYELRRSGARVGLEPKVFDVLRHLLANRDRVVSREELLRTLWPDERVVAGVVTRCIYALRRAFAQADPSGAPIATVRGRGYRFTADVRTGETASGRADTDAQDVLVGRERELGRLARALADARAGHGRIVLLTGPPGIGKTRLAEEAAAHARAQGVVVWIARSHELAGAPALFTWTQLLRACLRERDARELARSLGGSFSQLTAIVPELVTERAANDASLGHEPEAAPYRLFDAIAGAMRLATERTPHLVVIDDLHWADAPSLQLLAFLAPELAAWSSCIVATMRDDAWSRDDARRSSLAALTRHRHVERIPLTPLEPQAVHQYLGRMHDGATADLAESLYRRSEGNPLFMLELLRAHASGEAPLDGGAGAAPTAVRDLVGQRVAGLAAPTQRLLEAAAVVGRVFDLRIVAAALELDAATALSTLEPALARRLVEPVAECPGRFGFGHGLWCEALYDALSTARRVALHERVAQALQGSNDPPLGELAHHLLCALPNGDPDRAVAAAHRAAEAARAVQAHDEAARWYMAALDALAQAPAGSLEPRHELLRALGTAHGLAGRLANATAAFEQAAVLARRERRPIWLARDALGLRDCQPFRAVPDPKATALLEEALAALPDSEIALRARVLSRLAAVRSVETRHAMSARAAELATRISDSASRADVLRARLHALQGPGELAERLAVAQELLGLAERHAEPAWSWDGAFARYDAFLRLARMREADASLETCAELAERLSHPLLRMEVERHRAQRALCSGRYEQAIGGIDRAAQLALQLQSPFGRFYYSVQMFWLLRDKGLLGDVGREGERFVASYPWAEATARATVGVLHLERGEVEPARACLAFYAREGFENVPYGEDYLAVCAQLASLAVGLDERAHARTLYELLAPYPDQNVANGPLLYLGSAAHFLGLLSGALGRDAQARTHFEAALDANARMGARPALVRTQEAYATWLCRAHPNERAQALRAEARALRESIGMAVT